MDNLNIQDLDIDDLQIDPYDEGSDQHVIMELPEKTSHVSSQRKPRIAAFNFRPKVKSQFQDNHDGRIAINLQGLRALLQLQNQNEQLSQLIERLRSGGLEVVLTSEPTEEVKIGEDVKLEKLEQTQKGALKIQEYEDFQETNFNQGQNKRKIVLAVSPQMRRNYESFGRIVYYTEALKKDSEDLNISHLCSDCNACVGIFYCFTDELQPALLAIYCIIGERDERSYAHLLLPAFMRANQGWNKFERITFNGHNFVEISRLRFLAQNYYSQEVSKGKKIPKYEFALDPLFARQQRFFIGQHLPEQQTLDNILLKLLQTESKQEFALLKDQLFKFLVEYKIFNHPLSNGFEMSQFIEEFFQVAEYICITQIEVLIGMVELNFKKHPGLREHLIRDLREQLISQCAQVYTSVAQVHPGSRITAPALLFLALGVAQQVTTRGAEDNLSIVNDNFKKQLEDNPTEFEIQVPELAFLKQECSLATYQLVFQELIECIRLEVNNDNIEQHTHYFHLELEQQDQLYFQQYKALPLFVRRVGTKQYYNVKQFNGRWQCECGYSRRYGVPCRHEIKVCILTSMLLRNQIDPCYIHEEYYERCSKQHQPLIEKIEAQKRKDEIILTPLGTEDGRQELINFRTKHRMVGKGDYM